MPDRNVLFGTGLGAWNGADAATAAESVRLITQADRDGLDLFTVADHPYFGAAVGVPGDTSLVVCYWFAAQFGGVDQFIEATAVGAPTAPSRPPRMSTPTIGLTRPFQTWYGPP